MTGKLDQATMKEMNKPRCGLPDVVSKDEGKLMKRFSTLGKWKKTDLKYYVSYGADLSPALKIESLQMLSHFGVTRHQNCDLREYTGSKTQTCVSGFVSLLSLVD